MAERNLRGYFRSLDLNGDCVEYCVILSPTFQDHAPYQDITLAGDQPFVLQYESSKTPFEPIRKSVASIRIVADEFFHDMYGDDIQHTRVILMNTDEGTFEFEGYLTNNLLNQPQDDCTNVFTIEAIDMLSTLEYIDYYTVIPNKKQIVSFEDILANIMACCGHVEHLYVDSTVKNESGETIHMDELFISEQNFFSSDTDEPWTMYDVLYEICQYLGYTAVQYKNDIYLYDPQAHTSIEWTTSGDTWSAYPCDVYSGDFHTYTSYAPAIFQHQTVDAEDIMGTGADISLETIYNKVTVQDSFYEIEDFIPDIYDDDLLTNKDGEAWRCHKLNKVGNHTPRYVNKRNTEKNDASEDGYEFYQRQFWHKNYSSVYRDKNTMVITHETDTPYRIVYTRFDYNPNHQSIPTGFTETINVYNNTNNEREITVDWKAGTYTGTDTQNIAPMEFGTYTWHFETNSGSTAGLPTVYFRIDNGEWILYNTSQSSMTRGVVGATIVDFGSTAKADQNLYNYEVESQLDFDRYILISQCDKPDDYHSNPRPFIGTPSLRNYFPKIFELNSGYTKPIIIDDKCYLVINGSAKYERYTNKDYINDEWTSDCTGIGGAYNVDSWNIFTGDNDIYTAPPCLVLNLKIGDYWWNGSAWTTTNTPFVVDIHTPTDEDGAIDFSQWYNSDLKIINNVSWSDYAGVSGYKIPLTGVNFDFNSDIKFEICTPSKLQVYEGSEQHDGMNSYCWLKDFNVLFATKGSENYDLSDVVYENVIDEMSVNTLSDISLKITTYPSEGKHSYSNVGYNGKLLNKVVKLGLDGEANVMEEQIIKKYVNQYNTNTISQNMTLNLRATPISRVKDSSDGKYYHVCGQEIDFARASQRVNLIESKKYNN